MVNIDLNLKLKHSMVITPQLRQSIGMLLLNMIDLIAFINKQSEENPFLEIVDNAKSIEDNVIEDNEPDIWRDDHYSPAIYDSDLPNYTGVIPQNEENLIENISLEEKTLKDYIISQINIYIKDPVQKFIALHLTDMLDDSGYLTSDLADLPMLFKCDYKEIESTLEILQKFDPVGIFSRNVAECLSIQLKDKDRFDPAMQKLIENLHLLGDRNYKPLCNICGVDDEDLLQMCREIRELNPKPGSGYLNDNIQVIYPDVFLEKGSDNKWQIKLNTKILPKLLVNREYYAKINKQTTDKESKIYLSAQYHNANWLTKALDQRANTILKVASEIIYQQDDFFEKGIHYLKPLILSDIATNIDMHESTVSRIINGKYISTHMGMYEMKYFFTSAIPSTDGQASVSSKSIKYKIKELIDRENPKMILSDQKIASILRSKSINIARRTVMKYRESLKITSSVQRRKSKNL